MEEHNTKRRLGWAGYASYVPCSLPKTIYCNSVLAQRNFRNQLKISLSMDKLRICKLRFSNISFYTYAPYTSLHDNESAVARLTCLATDSFLKGLGKAYAQRFIGDSATEFIKHIERADVADQRTSTRPLFAKIISVVQSSGTGKSRMLTEVCTRFGCKCYATNFR